MNVKNCLSETGTIIFLKKRGELSSAELSCKPIPFEPQPPAR